MGPVRTLLYLLLLLLGGCGGGGTAQVALSWQFADGRRCADTGAANVTVQVGSGMPATLDCASGLLPAATTIDGVPQNGTTLTVQALSPEGAALYSGTLTLDQIPSIATVTLYAEKMR
jgi:hypothetical protein